MVKEKRRENLAGFSLLKRVNQLNSHCRGIMFNLKTFKSMNNQHIVVSVNLKRTIKIMKLTVLMLTVCLSQMVAATYAQTTKQKVSAKEET